MNMFAILLLSAVSVGIIFLQIFFSKTESKWPGLILPVISFLAALLFPLLMAVVPPEGITKNYILETVITFLLLNIPTVILLGIYFVCREKLRHKKQLDKMNIQDLH